jgi:hypothetical protein
MTAYDLLTGPRVGNLFWKGSDLGKRDLPGTRQVPGQQLLNLVHRLLGDFT